MFNLAKIFQYMGVIVALIFIGFGIFVFASNMFENLPSNYKIIFGTLLVAYGGFRLASILIKMKQKNSDQQEDE